MEMDRKNRFLALSTLAMVTLDRKARALLEVEVHRNNLTRRSVQIHRKNGKTAKTQALE